jgi:hypothetical protein
MTTFGSTGNRSSRCHALLSLCACALNPFAAGHDGSPARVPVVLRQLSIACNIIRSGHAPRCERLWRRCCLWRGGHVSAVECDAARERAQPLADANEDTVGCSWHVSRVLRCPLFICLFVYFSVRCREMSSLAHSPRLRKLPALDSKAAIREKREKEIQMKVCTACWSC